MPTYIGSNQLTKMYLGDVEIVKAYLGDKEVYSSVPPGPVNYTLTQKSVLEHDTAAGQYNAICKIDDTHFAVAYSSTNQQAYLKTFRVNADLSITEIDSLAYGPARSYTNAVLLIDATHLIVFHSGNSYNLDGYAKTFSMDGNCDNLALVDDEMWSGGNDFDMSSACKIDDTHFAVAYTGQAYDGYITTFVIDGSYQITRLATLEHDTAQSKGNSLVMIDGTHCILFYVDTSDQGIVRTFSINTSTYVLTQIDSEVIALAGGQVSIKKLDDDHYAIAYQENSSKDGFTKIITIDESYNIAVTSTLEHDTTYGWMHTLEYIDAAHFMLAYGESISGPGSIKTFSVDGSYNITQVDIEDLDTVKAQYIIMQQLTTTKYAVVYEGLDDDGYVKVFEID